jgi:hypothetical protein
MTKKSNGKGKTPPTFEAALPNGWVEGNWPYDEVKLELKRKAMSGEGPPVLTSYIWGKTSEAEQLIVGLEKTGARLVTRSEGLEGKRTARLYLWRHGAMTMSLHGSEGIGLDIVLSDEKLFNRVMAIVRKHVKKEVGEEPGHIYLLAPTKQGLKPHSLGKASVKLQRGNYSKSVLTAYDALLTQMRSDDPFGRLVLFEGRPGSGKTYLVRAMADAMDDALFVYASTSIVGNMDNPQLVPVLLDLRDQVDEDEGKINRVVLVVEDADALVEQRTQNSKGVLSTLLNLTSGLLGDLTNIFVVATYNNVDTVDLDRAIVRDGRMLAHLEVGELDAGQGARILRRLLKDKAANYDGEPVLASVYAAAREAGWCAVKPKLKRKRRKKKIRLRHRPSV